MRILGIVIMLAVLSGCGHKGPVVPLGEPLPVAPAGFSALQRGDTLLLSWKIPAVNQDGSRIESLKGFEVLRMDFDGSEICDTCRDTARALRTLELDYLQGASRSGDTITLPETLESNHNIRPLGQDFTKGESFHPKRRLSARDLGLLAAMNVPEVAVHRRPVVAIHVLPIQIAERLGTTQFAITDG